MARNKGCLRIFLTLFILAGVPALAEVPARPLSAVESARLARFIEPSESLVDDDQQMARVNQVDPNHVVPVDLLKRALHYYDVNFDKIANQNYLAVVDYARHSSKGRFFIINMKTGDIAVLHVAHGEGSDPGDTGYATRFSNVDGSLASSVGFYETAETYSGDFGYSLRLDGLSSTNSAARDRNIVIHGADDVYDQDRQPARSYGCLSVPLADVRNVIDKLKGGTIIYAQRSESGNNQ